MNHDELDALVTRLYRAAVSIADTGWQELLKNAAFSLSAAQRRSALVAAVALTDTVLVLAEHAGHLDRAVTTSLRQGLRAALSSPSAIESQVAASNSDAVCQGRTRATESDSSTRQSTARG